jgi:hypothetical protein
MDGQNGDTGIASVSPPSSVTAYPPLRGAGTRTATIRQSVLCYFMDKEGRADSLDVQAFPFTHEPQGLVDNESHRGGGCKA